MRPVILLYSFTGNNRLAADYLSQRLSCEVVEVRPRRRRFKISIALDIWLKRFPKIHPVTLPPNDHVLVMAPLWDMWVAHPMRAALKRLGAGVGPYSFLSFSGSAREGQTDHVERQLAELVGRGPEQHWEMYVNDLVPDEIKNTIKVSSYQVSPDELARYPVLDEVVAHFKK